MRFISLFLLLCVVLLVLSGFCRFWLCKCQAWYSKMFLSPIRSKKKSKSGPKWPNTDTPWQIPRARKSKRRSNEVKQWVHGTATTTGCPCCLPWPVVGAARPCCLARTAMHLLLLPICVFLSCTFVFLCSFPVCATNLPLKNDVFGYKRDLIPFYHHSIIIYIGF